MKKISTILTNYDLNLFKLKGNFKVFSFCFFTVHVLVTTFLLMINNYPKKKAKEVKPLLLELKIS